MDNRRVVVTGLGAVTPLGNDVKTTWENAMLGKSGAGIITKFNAEKFKTRFACEVKGFDPSIRLERNEIRKTDLFTQYALYAADEAIIDSGLTLDEVDPFDVGVIWGSGQGGMTTFESEMKNYMENEFNPRFSPFFIPKILSNMAAGMISIKNGYMGINYTSVSACASANTAFMDAMNYIKLGKAKVIVAGGSESPISEASIGGFNALKALSTENDSPGSASKPFDVNRNGFVMGEGGASIILEDYEHAKSRGAKIYAELAGASMTSDAYHITATHPEGKGAYEAIKRALDEADLKMSDVDYVNAHATSTPVGDLSEIKAISDHIKDSDNTHVGGSKSMTGHLLGAAGAIEALFSILSIRDNIIPPTINTKEVDPAIPDNVQLVLGTALKKNVSVALSNTFGFGGHNATVVFREI
ncbi:MAG: 3-oxoacyl-[acyl-carrier-protein] synthase II [Cyclobacteriaceae bacterium]|jgi:3-oxoacyl-[acyl-carrier-protein] synthase II